MIDRLVPQVASAEHMPSCDALLLVKDPRGKLSLIKDVATASLPSADQIKEDLARGGQYALMVQGLVVRN